MISSLGIFSATSKTDEIMSRYRPIAPKPQLPLNSFLEGPPAESPFLRSLSSYQKTRPTTRSRKRTKPCNSTAAAQKRAKTHHPTQQPSSHAPASCLLQSTQLSLSFGHGLPCLPYPSTAPQESPPACGELVTLPLLPCACHVPALSGAGQVNGCDVEGRMLEWNWHAEAAEDENLLQKLQAPIPSPTGTASVITPQPLRPIGSSISVGSISEITSFCSSAAPVLKKRPEEVEEEVESESLPSVISDSNNKVRLANSAYKEMVGQPECPWLDSMIGKDGRGVTTTSTRISGEVMLHLSDSLVPICSNGFSCRAKIEWASNGQKTLVDAPCDVIRQSCDSKDYLFTWRFLVPKSKP